MANSRMLKKFQLDGHSFKAEDCLQGILINPSLPKRFDDTANDRRSDSQIAWWLRPFIITRTFDELHRQSSSNENQEVRDERGSWLKHWPSGTRFDVRRLDGGAWDRSTNHGSFPSLEQALAKADSLAGASGYTKYMWGGDHVKFPLQNPPIDEFITLYDPMKHGDAVGVLSQLFSIRELWLDSTEVGRRIDASALDPKAVASAARKARAIFAAWNGVEYLYPAFQFEPNGGEPRARIEELVAELPRDSDGSIGSDAALWVFAPDYAFDGSTPAETFASDPDRAIQEARIRRSGGRD